ncbi:hypothetical protein LSTR_LSTR002272 [Laodelphax striatellus]|uniref:Uncharacterized protein n=1 Tax=Laodelphax striatellus TaxID=195883 RepID=A0A482XGA0_LAOST|nr:hypothetical protein LSTR_LSTR002272 [Laodelphax striatellus]
MPNDSAVITSIMSTNFPSYALEQPTVTICSPYKVVKSRVDEFFRIMTFDSDIQKYELEQTISIFAHYLQRNKPDISKKSNKSVMIIIMKWTDFLEKNYWTISDFLIFHHQPCDEFILKCYVARKPTICSDIFRVSKTRYGLCCSYDYLQTRDALLLKVNPPLKKRRNNFRQYNGLFEDGITFLLNLSHQNPIYSSNEYNAALVYLHSRDDYPFVYTNAAWISSGIEMVYRYSINAMVSSTAVKNLDPSLRKCYSRDEVKLKFFDHYTLENCNIEADMELMIEKCNCLLTRYPNQGFVKDCTVYNSFCYHSLGIDYSFYHKKFVNINGKRMQCLERCNYVRHIPTSNSAPIADPELNSYGVWDDIKNITGLALFSLFRGSTESVVYEKTLTATNLELIVWISGFAGPTPQDRRDFD